jgi:hypothetical protein
VASARYLGSATRIVVDLGRLPPPDERGYRDPADRGEIAVLVPGGQAVPQPGAHVGLQWDPEALHVMGAA